MTAPAPRNHPAESGVTYELWAEYAPTSHGQLRYTKPPRLIVTLTDLEDAVDCAIGARLAERQSRQMAKALEQPHHDATHVLYECRVARTTVDLPAIAYPAEQS